jgi:hypothetical protein
MAPKLVIDGLDYPALRARERDLLAQAVSTARRFRVRIEGYGWADAIPDLLYPTTVRAPVDLPAESRQAQQARHEVPVAAGAGRGGGRVIDPAAEGPTA